MIPRPSVPNGDISGPNGRTLVFPDGDITGQNGRGLVFRKETLQARTAEPWCSRTGTLQDKTAEAWCLRKGTLQAQISSTASDGLAPSAFDPSLEYSTDNVLLFWQARPIFRSGRLRRLSSTACHISCAEQFMMAA